MGSSNLMVCTVLPFAIIFCMAEKKGGNGATSLKIHWIKKDLKCSNIKK